jgi:hypothetical protein
MPISRSQIRTENSTVACTPPATTAIQGKTKDGFKTASQKTQLMELEVVFEATLPIGNTNRMTYMQPGMKVFVNHENTVHEWMKRAYTVDGKEFILVPSQYVLMTRSVPYQEYSPEELKEMQAAYPGGVIGMGTNNAALAAEQRPSPVALPEAGGGVAVGSGG